MNFQTFLTKVLPAQRLPADPDPDRRGFTSPSCVTIRAEAVDMDGLGSTGQDDLLDPPPRLYERLRQIAGYDWDESKLPFHSTYGFW